MYKNYPSSLTAREVSEELGIKRQQVADLLSRWHLRKFGYCKRSKVAGTKAYRYKITEKGTQTLIKYQRRVDEGFSLNLKIVKKEQNYIGINNDDVTLDDVIREMRHRKETKDVDH